MPFEYSCFISYRHSKFDYGILKRFIEDLYEALSSELEAHTSKPIFQDTERLRGGDFFDESLAEALCKSICMVIVYAPIYFDRTHTYCAREYKAMERLEDERLKLLGLADNRQQHGLIIPVVFRGKDRLPKEISGKRHYYNLDDFNLYERRMSLNRRYAPVIRQIAEVIADRCYTFEALSQDPCSQCATFKLPSETEVQQWLRDLNGPQTAGGSTVPFVLREEGR